MGLKLLMGSLARAECIPGDNVSEHRPAGSDYDNNNPESSCVVH